MKKLIICLLGCYTFVMPSVDSERLRVHPRYQDYALGSKVQVEMLLKKKSDYSYLRLYLFDETQALKKELASMKLTEKSLQDQLKKLKAVYIPFGEFAEKRKTEIESIEKSIQEAIKDQKEFIDEIQSNKNRLLRLDTKLKIIDQEQQRIKDTENSYHQRALNQIIAQNAGQIPSSFKNKNIEIVKEGLMKQDNLFDTVQDRRERNSELISELYAEFLKDPDLQHMYDLGLQIFPY